MMSSPRHSAMKNSRQFDPLSSADKFSFRNIKLSFMMMLKLSCIRMLTSRSMNSSCQILGDGSSFHSPEQFSSAEIAANDDILTEILLCLPVKSLLKFKAVSKQWRSLISDPYFIQNHSCRYRSIIPGFFLDRYSYDYNKPDIDFVFLDGKRTSVPFNSHTFINKGIVQSCNGLLCCVSSGVYYIFNPSTNRSMLLPQSPNRGPRLTRAGSLSFAFNPHKSPHYKVICMLRKVDEARTMTGYMVEIYSSETGSWSLSAAFESRDPCLFKRPGVFWNGALHWISVLKSPPSSIYFDVDRELMNMMPVPPIPDGWAQGRVSYFGECRGHLHLIQMYEHDTTLFDILEMETNYAGWTVKYRVDINTVPVAYPKMVREPSHHYPFDFTVLLVEENEEEDLASVILQIPRKFISYNLKDGTFKEIHSYLYFVEDSYRPDEWFYPHLYIDSLASV